MGRIDDVEAVLAVMAGETPRGIVNRGILDDPFWREKLAGHRKRFAG